MARLAERWQLYSGQGKKFLRRKLTSETNPEKAKLPLITFMLLYASGICLANTQTSIPEAESANLNTTQYLTAIKLGRMLLTQNSVRVMSAYNMGDLVTSALVAHHQADLIGQLFAEDRKADMAAFDPHSEKIRTMFSMGDLHEDLQYPADEQDANMAPMMGTFDGNLAFAQAESGILKAKATNMFSNLDTVLEFMSFTPLDPAKKAQRVNLSPAIHALKNSLSNLNLQTFIAENEGDAKSLDYAKIMAKLADFQVEPPPLGDSKAKSLHQKFGTIPNTREKLGERLTFVSAKGLVITNHLWTGSGAASGGKRKKRELKRTKRQLALAAIGALIGYVGSTVIGSFRSSIDHEAIAQLTAAQNQNSKNQALLASQVQDMTSLLQHVVTRQTHLYESIAKLSKTTYRNQIKIQYQGIALVLSGTLDLIENEIRNVLEAIQSVNQGGFPSSLIKVDELRFGINSGLLKAQKAAFKEVTADLRILLKSRVQLLNVDLSLKFIFSFPVHSMHWGSPQIIEVPKGQILTQNGIIYKLNLESTLFAIFEEHYYIAPIPSTLFQKCSLFIEQIKAAEDFKNLSSNEHYYLCYKDHPVSGINLQIFKKSKNHCIFALLSKDPSRILKFCPLKVISLKSERLQQKPEDHFTSLDLLRRVRNKKCFVKNEVTQKFEHSKVAIFTEISENFHLPSNCYFQSQNFLALSTYSGMETIAPRSFTKDTKFDPDKIFADLKLMEKTTYKSEKQLAIALREYAKKHKESELDLNKLSDLKRDLKGLKPSVYVHPVHTSKATLIHMAITAVCLVLLITIVFYAWRLKAPVLLARFTGRARDFFRRLCCRKQEVDPGEEEERRSLQDPPEPTVANSEASPSTKEDDTVTKLANERINLRTLGREVSNNRSDIRAQSAKLALFKLRIEALEKTLEQLSSSK